MTADCQDDKDIEKQFRRQNEVLSMLVMKFSFEPLEAEIQLCKTYVNQFMAVLSGVIHTLTLLENLLSVIVTHSNVLLTSPETPAWVWHLRWTQLTLSINAVFRKSAYSLMSSVTTSPNSIVTTIVNSDISRVTAPNSIVTAIANSDAR